MTASAKSHVSPVRVFISYSHDSQEHCDRVLEFAQQLRRDGIDAELDQFHQDELVHWPRWCEEQLRPENSKYVLCVCTAEYRRRVESKVHADVGKGVFWEAALIYNYVYHEKKNQRFIPVLIGGAQEDAIPQILRGWDRYHLTTFALKGGDREYEGLHRLLTRQQKVKPEPLGKPVSLLERGAQDLPEQVLPPLEIPERKTDFMRTIEDIHKKVDHIEQVSLETKADTSEILKVLGHTRTMLRWPKAQDFTGYLAAKREGFVGREWLFERVIGWTALGTTRAMLITGDPGLGKSAIVGEMVERRENMGVIGWFCCRWEQPDQLAPRVFVEAIAASLAENLPAYTQALTAPELQTLLKEANTGTEVGPRTLFEQLVLSPLVRLPDPPSASRLILIDAIDESLVVPNGIVDLLTATLDQWPQWLRVVATTRPYPDVLHSLHEIQAEVLRADDAENRADLEDYVAGRLGLSSTSRSDSTYTGVLVAAQGNFLIAKALIDEIRTEHLRVEELLNANLSGSHPLVPLGLQLYYERSFARLFQDVSEFEPAGTVLALAMAALEPLDLPTLQAASGLERTALGSALKKLAVFLPQRTDKRFAFFHKSVRDWLDAETIDSFGAPIAQRFAIDIRVGRKALADWTWKEYKRGVQNASLYCLKYIVAHLHEADQNEQVRTVLLNFDWLRAKLQASDVNALIADFDFAPQQEDLQFVQAAIRLSAHVLIRDPHQLGGQLAGRLLGSERPDIQALVAKVDEWRETPWLRPLRPSLARPGGPLIRRLEGHTGSVTAVVVTADGRRAISASRDTTLRVWDLESGKSLRVLEGHTGVVNSVAVTADGHRAISASEDTTLRVWDLESGESLRVLEGHTGVVNSVAVTADGRRAISASSDTTLRVWDLESGKSLRVLEGHTGSVNSAWVTVDGRRAVSESWDNTLRVWDLESGKSLRTLEDHTSLVNSVAVTADGRRAISASSYTTLRVWDLESGKNVCLHEGDSFGFSVVAVAVTADGRRAISASAHPTLRMWDLESGESLCTLRGQAGRVTALVVTTDGRRAISGSSDRTLRVWDLKSGGRTLEGHAGPVTALAVTADGRRAISASWDRTVRVWDLESGKGPRILEGHSSVTSLAVTADGRRAISASWDNILCVWDLGSGKCLRTSEDHSRALKFFELTADGRRAILGLSDNTLRVWDLKRGKSLRTLEGHTGVANSVAVTTDNRAISASEDTTLRVWDLESGRSLRVLEGHTGVVNSVAVTADGRRAIS